MLFTDNEHFPSIFLPPNHMKHEYEIVCNCDKTKMYDEIEQKLCNPSSGFGRNYDAFYDILTGGFGLIYTHVTNGDKVTICFKKCKILPEKMLKIIHQAIDENAIQENGIEITLH